MIRNVNEVTLNLHEKQMHGMILVTLLWHRLLILWKLVVAVVV